MTASKTLRVRVGNDLLARVTAALPEGVSLSAHVRDLIDAAHPAEPVLFEAAPYGASDWDLVMDYVRRNHNLFRDTGPRGPASDLTVRACITDWVNGQRGC